MTDILTDDEFVRLFQRTFGLKEDGWAGNDTVARLRVLAAASGAPVDEADEADLPADYWPMLSKIESGDRPYIKAATSSASGLYQFIQSTWQGEGGAWGGDDALAFGGLRPSVEEQLARAKTFTAKNAAYLSSRGIPINRASLYAAHFLGAGTAAAALRPDVPVNAQMSTLVSAGAVRANRSILEGKTVGEFLSWLHRKTGEWAR